MLKDVTGVVLAGGSSTRMGHDKARVVLQGKTLLERVLEPLRELCTDLVVVSSAEGLSEHRDIAVDARLAADLLQGRGPLGGLHAGLQASRTQSVLLVGCDTPFLQPALLGLVADAAVGKDAAVPRLDGIPQTLQSVYSQSCLPAIGNLLAQGRPGLRHLLPLVDVAYLEQDEIIGADPNLLSFFNVNSEGDLELARQQLGGG